MVNERIQTSLNPLSTNSTKWSNTPQTIRRQQAANCFSVSDHFVGLALKELIHSFRAYTPLSFNAFMYSAAIAMK